MKKVVKGVVASTIVVAGLFAGMQSANATVIWDNVNYSGDSYGGDSSQWVGSMNDRASSIKNYGYRVTMWQNINYGGAGTQTYNDYNALSSLPFPFPPGGDWNDEISSYYRS